MLSHAKTGFILLEQSLTISEALTQIRTSRLADGVIYFYVVNKLGQLVGVIPTRKLLTCPLAAKLQDIMSTRVITIPSTANLLDACEMFILYKFLAFPIVTPEKTVCGVIEAGLLGEELALSDDASENGGRHDAVFETLGLHLSELKEASAFKAFKFRFPWLLATIGSGTVAAILGNLYETTLAHSLILVFFLSLVTGLGESISTQSVTLTIQGLLHKVPTWPWYLKTIRRELKTALLLGLACASIVTLLVMCWRGLGLAPLAVGCSLILSLCSACVIGVTIPTLLHTFKLDPKIAAGPLTLAVTDIFTLTFYYNIGRWLLG